MSIIEKHSMKLSILSEARNNYEICMRQTERVPSLKIIYGENVCIKMTIAIAQRDTNLSESDVRYLQNHTLKDCFSAFKKKLNLFP